MGVCVCLCVCVCVCVRGRRYRGTLRGFQKMRLVPDTAWRERLERKREEGGRRGGREEEKEGGRRGGRLSV